MPIEMFKFTIVGLPYHRAPEIWLAHQAGSLDSLVSGRVGSLPRLDLSPDPANPRDPNAIEVVIPRGASATGAEIKLGFIGRDKAPKVHKILAAATTLVAALDIEDRFPEPVEKKTWRGYLMTDAIAEAADVLRPAGFDPTPDWTSAFGGAAPAGASRPRPRRGPRQVHAWI